jgi:hypothetical protein
MRPTDEREFRLRPRPPAKPKSSQPGMVLGACLHRDHERRAGIASEANRIDETEQAILAAMLRSRHLFEGARQGPLAGARPLHREGQRGGEGCPSPNAASTMVPNR